MYVEYIILEGFKTYMNRTVISNFDSQFNAITGLNGSGKSNILDAIQFLLGSTSKDMLRLKNGLTELIYKEGFAGIDKASVTIRFRCFDKALRPVGYYSNEELVITRQITKDKITKFFVNGLASNLTKVKNLFRSVQLNIENPHFLVKQGQITKIINLKPLELLAMIEYTAGTAYYNKTKQDSERMIEKKEQKLKGINDILSTSIEPQMQKMDADRRRYTAYKDKYGLLHHLNEKLRTYEFSQKTNTLRRKYNELAHQLHNHELKNTQLRETVDKIHHIMSEIRQMGNRISNPTLKNYNQLKLLLSEQEGERGQIKTRLQHVQNEVMGLKQKTQYRQTKIENKRKYIYWQYKLAMQADKQKYETEGLLQYLGKAGYKDAGYLMEKQLAQEESQARALEVEIKAMLSKKDIIKVERDSQDKTEAELQLSTTNIASSLAYLERDITALQEAKEPQPIDDPELSSNSLKYLYMTRKKMIGQYYQLNFFFKPPQGEFDQTKVKGKLFTLFRPKERIHERAIEIGAAGKLYNIVVDNEHTSKYLIEQYCFGRNVTVIPNSRIQYKRLREETIEEARRIAKEIGGLARPAYELIQYSKYLENSIMFAFSNFIVCSSAEIARRIAYHSNRQLTAKCVTYDGDVYEFGTLTGGQNSNQVMILPQYSQLKEIEYKLSAYRMKFDKQRMVYEYYQKNLIYYRSKQKELEIKLARKEKIKQKMLNLSLNIKRRDYAHELEDIQSKIYMLEAEVKEKRMKISQMKGNNTQGRSLTEQKKQLLEDKKLNDRKLSEAKRIISMLEVEVYQLKSDLKFDTQHYDKLYREIIDLYRRYKQLANTLKEYQIEFELAEQYKKKFEKEMTINYNKLKALNHEHHELKQTQYKLEHYLAANETVKTVLTREINEYNKSIEELMQTYTWLDLDKTYEFDSGFNYEATQKEYQHTAQEVDKLGKNAKMNIDDHSYTKMSEQYRNLVEKRKTLYNDKLTLLSNMHELDEKRAQTLEKCFYTVRNHLSKIFTDLLPGASAHLTLIDERDVTKGAYIYVQFNKVKKYLSELSGGQRSLLALSFILSLLLYKPSPFYILDEIDSALDLSHTENIGYMISQRFPQSQFILISLKEGMFQNANVLYKVQFVDGESKVERQALKKK